MRGSRKFTNKLRELLSENRPLFGTFANFRDASLVEYLGLAGFDWVVIDAEHEGTGVETTYHLVRAANAVGLGSVVRIPTNRPELALAYAETGVDALLCPHIDTPQAAVEFASSVRYWPDGARGAGSTSRAASYGFGWTPAEYFGSNDQLTLAIALLEDEKAFAHLDEIVKVPGIDIFTIGPGDLALSMGLPGQSSDPRVVDVITKAVPIIKGSGKPLIMYAADPSAARQAIQLGATMVVTSVTALLRGSLKDFLASADAVTLRA